MAASRTHKRCDLSPPMHTGESLRCIHSTSFPLCKAPDYCMVGVLFASMPFIVPMFSSFSLAPSTSALSFRAGSRRPSGKVKWFSMEGTANAHAPTDDAAAAAGCFRRKGWRDKAIWERFLDAFRHREPLKMNCWSAGSIVCLFECRQSRRLVEIERPGPRGLHDGV